MQRPFTLSMVLAITLSSALLNAAEASDTSVYTKLFFGGKTIDSNAWQDQDGHGSIGLLTDVDTGFYGLRVAVDLFGSGSEEATGSQVKGTYTAEAQVGLRKYCDEQTRMKPYVGGGINFAYATQENNVGSGTTEDEDMDIGFWINSGVDFSVSDNITAGVDLRFATSEVELYGESVDLNAMTTGLYVGYRW